MDNLETQTSEGQNSNLVNIASIGGDGIGPEVVQATQPVIDELANRSDLNITFNLTEVNYSGIDYERDGTLFDENLEIALRDNDLILFGALGTPSIPPGILERGVILAMRTAFDQAVNVRPVRLYPGVSSPVKGVTPEVCDIVFVRENLEGTYAGSGSSVHENGECEVALQESINTASIIRRTVKYAFSLAQHRRKKLTLCHKSNILQAAGTLWQRIVDEESQHCPSVEVDYVNADAMCIHLPLDPGRFDVIVTDNLFGDILTDLGAMVQGGIGLAASANINVERKAPSMVEGVHGSAPDIAGRGWACPYATMLSLAMGLAHCGHMRAAQAIEDAVVAEIQAQPIISGPDLPGGTQGVGERIAERVRNGESRELPGSLLDALALSRT